MKKVFSISKIIFIVKNKLKIIYYNKKMKKYKKMINS